MTTAAEHARAARTLRGRTTLDAAIRSPKTSGPQTTVGQVRELFLDQRVHAALIVTANGELLTVVERTDLAPQFAAPVLVRAVGRLDERTVGPDDDLERTWDVMRARGHRRLAVVDGNHRLLGLLCLKRTALGFCTDEGICARRLQLADTPSLDTQAVH